MLTVVSSNGNAFPVGGCVIREGEPERRSYQYQLILITPSGQKEYILSSTNPEGAGTFSQQSIPDWMIDQREKIIQALKEGTEILDFRGK